MNQPNLPAYLQGASSRNLSDTLGGNLGTGAPPYISIEGNKLTLWYGPDDSEPVLTIDPKTGSPYIDVAIIDVGDHASKVWYSKPFDPNNPSPPDCWSDNGIGPSRSCTSPQAKSCTPDPEGISGCKLAVWGAATSRVTGKPIPACAKQQKLALLIPDNDTLFQFRVPPNSLDNLRAYNAKFKGQPVGIDAVITRISFEQGVIGTLTFNAVNYIDQDTFNRRQAAIAAKATDVLVGRGDVPIAGLPAAQNQQALAAPQQTATPQLPATQQAGYVPNPAPLPPPQQVIQPAQQAPVQQAQPEAQPTRRRRRAATETQPGPVVGQQAPFRDPPAAGAQPQPQANGPAGAQTHAFGMAPGVAPDPALQSALDSIFK